VETIRKAAQEHAAKTGKSTAKQILKMTGSLLTAEFKSARMKCNKVSGWNLFLSEVKADVPDHIRNPRKADGLRPKFTGEYTKLAAEQWPDHRDEYMRKADIINKTGETVTKVPMALHQKRTIKKLKGLVCCPEAGYHLVPTIDADNSLIQTDELSGMGVAIIAYVVPSKSPPSLLLSNGVAQSYYSLIAATGRTINEFRTYCEGTAVQRQVKDLEMRKDAKEMQMECSGTMHRDTLRKTVNVKLLELLSMFDTKPSVYRKD